MNKLGVLFYRNLCLFFSFYLIFANKINYYFIFLLFAFIQAQQHPPTPNPSEHPSSHAICWGYFHLPSYNISRLSYTYANENPSLMTSPQHPSHSHPQLDTRGPIWTKPNETLSQFRHYHSAVSHISPSLSPALTPSAHPRPPQPPPTMHRSIQNITIFCVCVCFHLK